MIRSIFDNEPHYVSKEETITPEKLKKIQNLFVPMSQKMSEILGKPVDLHIGVKDLEVGEHFVDKRFVVKFYTVIDGQEKGVAYIDWKPQNPERPDTMEDGVIEAVKELRGHDLGYELFKIKRKIGDCLGYKKILLSSMKPEGFPDKIVDKEEEEKYKWVQLAGRNNPYVGATTYLGNITQKC